MPYGACTNVKTTIKTSTEIGKTPTTKTVTKKCGCNKFYCSSWGNQGGSLLCGSCGHSQALHE